MFKNHRIALLSGMSVVLASIGARQSNRVFGDANIRAAINRTAGMVGHRQRSRGPQAKPKKHRNLKIVGKRVRRKHRRAA